MKRIDSLPVGAKVKDPNTKYYDAPIVWRIVDKNHSGYPTNSVTLTSQFVITLKCFDAAEPSGSDYFRIRYGNPRYLYSNIRQWLNSSSRANTWYTAKHSTDAPPNSTNSDGNPYDTQEGFLRTFSSDFKNVLLDTTLKVAKNPMDGGGVETIVDKMFLASNTEVGALEPSGISEGTYFPSFGFNRVATPTAECVSNGGTGTVGEGIEWYLRTQQPTTTFSIHLVLPNGESTYGNPNVGRWGIRPFCNISSSTLVSDNTSDGCYTLFNTPPTAPPTITVPTSIYSGKSTTIQWAASTDPDGNSITYTFERNTNSGSWSYLYNGTSKAYTDSITASMNTVQYRVKAVDSGGFESAYTTSPTRTVTHNRPPTAPPTITVPIPLFSDSRPVISWAASTDPDGNPITYDLEFNEDGKGFLTTFPRITQTSYNSLYIKPSINTIQFRVRAEDSGKLYSAFTTSPVITVTHNLPPIISGTDGSLGIKNDTFSYEYTVTDPNNDATTVQEKLNGKLIRTYTATLGVAATMDVKGVEWVRLPQGTNTLTITATDVKEGSTVRTMTFTKQVTKLFATLETPFPSTERPKRINVNVTSQVPLGAKMQVTVCNNSNDEVPTWEDATDATAAHLAHVFKNDFKRADNWGVNVKVDIDRGTAVGECSLTGIGGNFE